MGVQDNPRAIGNWVKTGMGGVTNLIERLTAEGYPWDAEELLTIGGCADRLRAIAGPAVGAGVQNTVTVDPQPDAPAPQVGYGLPSQS